MRRKYIYVYMNRSVMVAVQGPDVAHPLYIHMVCLTCKIKTYCLMYVVMYRMSQRCYESCHDVRTQRAKLLVIPCILSAG
jgi:hypothetical protein